MIQAWANWQCRYEISSLQSCKWHATDDAIIMYEVVISSMLDINFTLRSLRELPVDHVQCANFQLLRA